ncbi:hypothetical protein PVAP13_1KG450120 [Panicum virgatum]|uniref:Uncharacterized protein n=1 Tax=Panicum virgatum TaxID=38727 RepID=A0A8T0XTW8_PANVG|nr:hypothetical protein PVAP13_1KG450110 [Panicum virgatum]KAG2660563.1 hypothetical protein PVAP13_1KG450120 [Panicum virgatum]
MESIDLAPAGALSDLPSSRPPAGPLVLLHHLHDETRGVAGGVEAARRSGRAPLPAEQIPPARMPACRCRVPGARPHARSRSRASSPIRRCTRPAALLDRPAGLTPRSDQTVELPRPPRHVAFQAGRPAAREALPVLPCLSLPVSLSPHPCRGGHLDVRMCSRGRAGARRARGGYPRP